MSQPTTPNAVPPSDADALQAPPIDGPAQPRLTFFQQPMVQNVLPLVTSLALHLGLILIGVLALKTYQTFVTVSQEQIIIPDATMAEGAEIGGVPNPGLGPDPTRAGAQDQIQDQAAQGWATTPTQSLEANTMGGTGEQVSTSMIGAGPGVAGSGSTGSGPGSGEAGGSLAPFGPPGGGGGLGPPSRFLGSGGNARLICYVCDASGSMLGAPFDLLKIELQKSINSLQVSQGFNMIFFQQAKFESFSQNLVLANQANKTKAGEFLQTLSLASNSDPMPGIRFAFQQKPQLIYLLTDGSFPDNQAVIEECKKLNAGKQVKINTIAFFSPNKDPADRKLCEDLLRTIAADSGGLFKVVLTSELMKQN